MYTNERVPEEIQVCWEPTRIETGKEESLPSVIADDKIQPSHQK